MALLRVAPATMAGDYETVGVSRSATASPGGSERWGGWGAMSAPHSLEKRHFGVEPAPEGATRDDRRRRPHCRQSIAPPLGLSTKTSGRSRVGAPAASSGFF